MSPMPETNKSIAKPMTPPDTMGWSRALFGTAIDLEEFDSGTDDDNSKPSKSQKTPQQRQQREQYQQYQQRLLPLSIPFQNLEGFHTVPTMVHSPDRGAASKAFVVPTPVIDDPKAFTARTAASTSSIQQLQQTVPRLTASERGTQTSISIPTSTSTSVPLQFPLRAYPSMGTGTGTANGARFSVPNVDLGHLRPGATRSNVSNYNLLSATRVVPVDRSNMRRRTNKYTRAGLFKIRRTTKGYHTQKAPVHAAMDNAQRNTIAWNTARGAVESPRHPRTVRIRPGVRLYPSETGGRLHGRLPSQQQKQQKLPPGSTANVEPQFVSNRKREYDDDDDGNRPTFEVTSTRKKRRLNLGRKVTTVHSPDQVVASKANVGSRPSTRTAISTNQSVRSE